MTTVAWMMLLAGYSTGVLTVFTLWMASLPGHADPAPVRTVVLTGTYVTASNLALQGAVRVSGAGMGPYTVPLDAAGHFEFAIPVPDPVQPTSPDWMR